MSTIETKQTHTPGALRAADRIIDRMLEWNGWPRSVISRNDGPKLAQIIDEQTTAPEMLEALEALVGEIRGTGNKWRLEQFAELGEAAIRKAKGEL